MAPILETLTRDPETQRARDIAPDEEAKSLMDEFNERKIFLGTYSMRPDSDGTSELIENEALVMRKIMCKEIPIPEIG